MGVAAVGACALNGERREKRKRRGFTTEAQRTQRKRRGEKRIHHRGAEDTEEEEKRKRKRRRGEGFWGSAPRFRSVGVGVYRPFAWITPPRAERRRVMTARSPLPPSSSLFLCALCASGAPGQAWLILLNVRSQPCESLARHEDRRTVEEDDLASGAPEGHREVVARREARVEGAGRKH
jgi:hypothetical protein